MAEKPIGEVIIVSSKKGAEPDFFEAMMKFQYGDREESEAGFKEMIRQTQPTPPTPPTPKKKRGKRGK